MNKITHHAVLPFIQDVDALVARFLEDEGEALSSAGMLLNVIQTVKENADDWVSDIWLVITAQGYEVHYEPAESVAGMDLDSIVLDLLVRGLEVQDDSLYGG